MKNSQLKAFLRVAETGSIRAAARALGLSQPAVTKALRELEAELDAPLIARSARGAELTECGRQLAVRARLAEEQLALARQDIRLLQGGKRAQVAVAITPLVFLGELPAVVRDFRRTMPYAQLKLLEGLLPMVLTHLREGAIDFAVATAMVDFLAPDIELDPIGQIEMMVACRPGHPLAVATRWSEVVDAEWLVHLAPGSHHSVLMEHLRRTGQPVPQRTIETNTFGVSWGMVTRSDALLILPARVADIEVYSRQIVRVPIDMALPTLTLGIMKLRAAPLSLAASRLVTLFRRHVQA